MLPPEIATPLARLQKQLQRLLTAHGQLKKQHEKAEKQLAEARAALAERDELIGQLQLQADVLKLGAHNWTVEEKRQLEKKLNGYLKDIEQCMNLLNR
jgi:septal ring factor EnvC (AmiA/AmiB activator)